MSLGTHFTITGQVQNVFTMKALATAALGPQWSDITGMLYETVLRLRHGSTMAVLWLLPRLPHHQGEHKHVCSS